MSFHGMHTEPSQKSSKSQLRKKLRYVRTQIAPRTRQAWDTQINQYVVEIAAQMQAKTVAAFLSFDGEPDLGPSLSALENQGVRLALPVVQSAPGKAVIVFRRWGKDIELQNNRYGIAEPAGTEDIHVAEIDLVLIPLVGWDRSGGRLGMGASFYDRLFQPFAALDRPYRMGVGYELQNVAHIPQDPWDIRLHGILTESGWFTCKG